MRDLFKRVQQQASRVIRRTVSVLVKTDRETGDPVVLPLEGRETTLSKDGSPDTITARFVQVYECGHPVEVAMGGKCFSCDALSCQQCHSQCGCCRKPCCLECSRGVDGERGQVERLCRPCWDSKRRRRLAKKVVWFLVVPFVETKREERR